jgi:ABC-type dipeptide/oligopeptide/nickel transport system ATPase component
VNGHFEMVRREEGAVGNAVLEVEDLNIYFQTLAGEVQAIDGLSLSLEPGEMVGLVGESGSGKSSPRSG